jgi:hypothetical protein
MRILVCCLAAFAFACPSSPSEPAPGRPGDTPAATAPAKTQAAAAPTKSPAELEAERKARAETALARVPAIKQKLAEVRGLAFKSDVPALYQTSDDFRAFVKKEIARELPPERAAKMVEAFVQLGLLEQAVDLPKTLEDSLVSQAGAYYDPAQKSFFLVMVPPSDMALDTITAHELTHALQDQHYDLKAYYPVGKDGLPTVDEDVMNARRFVVEGDATLAMAAYMATSMTGKDILQPDTIGVLKMQLDGLAKMDIDQLKEMSKIQQGGLADMGDEMNAALKAMDTIPLVIMLPMLESYTKGATPILVAYQHGGWKEVEKLFKRSPPDSTEQVLHPDTKLYPKRDKPTKVTLALPPGYAVVHSDVMGELLWRVYFTLWSKPLAEAAAAGWDGDRYAVVKRPDGKLASFIATVWDSDADAEEFERAYKATLSKRHGGDRAQDVDVAVERHGAKVFVVDGAPAGEAAAFVKGTKMK